jgi:hypothetical protein
MKALGCPAASKCEATVEGSFEAVPVTKTIANNSNKMNTDHVTL